MNNREMGNWLKKKAQPSGNFVDVEINNIANTLDVLRVFFYGKKHEWIAVCFLDESFVCKLIWFNKGADNSSVNIKILLCDALDICRKQGYKYILKVHNHPLSSSDLPDYGSRRANIQASYAHKKTILDFSETDLNSAAYWATHCHENGLSCAEAVVVAGDIKISGDKQIVDNFSANKFSSSSSTRATRPQSPPLNSTSFIVAMCIIAIILIYPKSFLFVVAILIFLLIMSRGQVP